MTAPAWLKFGKYRLNLAQIAMIERDEELLRFFNVHGDEMFARAFESERQADRVLKELFKFEEVRLFQSRYEGTEPDFLSEDGADEEADDEV